MAEKKKKAETENIKEEAKVEEKSDTNASAEKTVGADESELQKLKDELAAEKELLLRTAAEFDNYKRRTEKERLSAAEFTSAKLLKKLLPVFDNVDRANAADKDSADYAKGVEMIVKMLTDAVKELGLVEIGKVGDTFDPTMHEAVMHVEDESFGENTVCNVLQKGYKFGETVIRPAMVQVAN